METVTWALEAKFDGINWVDFSTDVLIGEGLAVEYGITGNGPMDLLAGPGSLAATLNNAASNSGGLAGYYSPGHTNQRSGFADGLQVRLKITHGGTTRYKFVGWLKSAPPGAGTFMERMTPIAAEDWMAIAGRSKLNQLSIQTSKRTDQIVPVLLAAITIQPTATSLATCQETFPTAMDTDQDERDTIYSVLGKLARNELGPIFIKGDTSTGGVLRVENRHYRLTTTSLLATLDNIMDQVDVEYSRDQVANLIRGSYYPRRPDTSNVTLATLQDQPAIGPGLSRTFILRYVDPTGLSQRISAIETVAPVAGTDYKFGTNQGTDQDLNANLNVTSTRGANSASITVENTGAVSGFLNLLKIRGKGSYTYEPVTYTASDAASIALRGEISEDIQYSYVANYTTVRDFTDYVKRTKATPRLRLNSITFLANKSSTLMAAALDGEPSSRVSLKENQTGLNGEYWVNSVKLYLETGGKLTCTWGLTPADSVDYWRLGDSALSLLGNTTILGF